MTHQANRVALVIGSGGLKCSAALGVWQVLREAGLEVDMTVGCSGGSLYATAIALGYSQEEAAALTQQLWTAELAQQRHAPSIRHGLLPRLFGFRPERFGLVDDQLIMAQLERVLGDVTFAETKLPLFLAATDLHSGEAITIHSGRIVDGIRASIAIPIVFAPWAVNGRTLSCPIRRPADAHSHSQFTIGQFCFSPGGPSQRDFAGDGAV